MAEREAIAGRAAEKLRAARELPGALVGFDGFNDAIMDVVDRRRDMTPRGYERIRTIEGFAARVGAAAGKSANIELVQKELRFGGNGPLMAGALGRLGAAVTYIGAVGDEADPRRLHPLYAELGRRCRAVIPVGPPAHTDALEFDDGKIMLGRPANVQRVTWELLKQEVGIARLRELVAGAGLIGIVNWTLCGGVEGIWRGLCDEVFPGRGAGTPPTPASKARHVFIDLSDPAKRTDADLERALGVLGEMNRLVPVTLGLNLSEAERVARVVGAAWGREDLAGAAARIRAHTGLECVVIHPREGASAATAAGEASWFDGPLTPTPRLSTGAGDHFNAGFALARAVGLDLDEALAAGCATSGAYVRDALSPDMGRLTGFLSRLPRPGAA